MKTNWQIKKLGEIESISFLRGNGLNKLQINEDGLFPCILYGDLYTKYKSPIIKAIKSRTDFEGKVKSVIGDVLVPGTTTADAHGIAIARSLNIKDVVIGSDINILRTRNKELLSDYISYFLNGPAKNILASYANGTNILHLSNKNIQQIVIPYPELSEQKRIVKILDGAFEKLEKAKENTEKNLQNSKKLFESYLKDVFSNPGKDWEHKTLEEISFDFGRGKSKHRPRNDKRLYGGIYPFIQTGDIRNSSHFINEYSQTYNETGLSQSKLWPKGTICITIAANIAETGILTFDACFPDSVIGIVVDPHKAESGFVEYLLQFFKVSIQSKGKGSAQANINIGTFENERFPFPKVSEQKQIVKMLDQLSEKTQKLESIYKQKLESIDELKKSILQKAFNGDL